MIRMARVKENWDQDHPGMLKVEYLVGEEGLCQTDWVRIILPYGTGDSGIYWLPEIGSQVAVGFEEGHWELPLILGCVYEAGSGLVGKSAKEANPEKRLLTAGGNELVMRDEKDKCKIGLTTPLGLTLELDDEKKEIRIWDGNNRVTLDKENGKVTLEAQREILLKAGGQSQIKMTKNSVDISSAGVELEGKQSVKLSGQSTNVEGNMVSVKGDGNTSVEAGAMLQLKGQIIKMN